FCYSTAISSLYTLSLHDALPICSRRGGCSPAAWSSPQLWLSSPAPPDRSPAHTALYQPPGKRAYGRRSPLEWYGSRSRGCLGLQDRKSTRLNSSHVKISYAVFCL